MVLLRLYCTSQQLNICNILKSGPRLIQIHEISPGIHPQHMTSAIHPKSSWNSEWFTKGRPLHALPRGGIGTMFRSESFPS